MLLNFDQAMLSYTSSLTWLCVLFLCRRVKKFSIISFSEYKTVICYPTHLV